MHRPHSEWRLDQKQHHVRRLCGLLLGMQPAEEFSILAHEIAHLCVAEKWRPPRNAHKNGSIKADQRHIIVE